MKNRRFSYRFVVNAETVGTICYLGKKGMHLKEMVVAGYVLTSLGDRGAFHYKRSRKGQSLADRALETVLKYHDIRGGGHNCLDFNPSRGSEERQYCSPGYDMPVGCFMRAIPGTYPEYHTSLDDKDFVSFDAMLESVNVLFETVQALEANHYWINKHPHGEPHLSKNGLYPTVSIKQHNEKRVEAMLWLLNQADGAKDVLDISKISGVPPGLLSSVALDLEREGLIGKKF